MATTYNTDSASTQIDEDKEALEEALTDHETVEWIEHDRVYKITSNWKSLTGEDVKKIRNAGFGVIDIPFNKEHISVRKRTEESEPEPTIVDKIRDIVDNNCTVEDDRDTGHITIRLPQDKNLILPSTQRKKIEALDWEVDFIGGRSDDEVHIFLSKIDE